MRRVALLAETMEKMMEKSLAEQREVMKETS